MNVPIAIVNMITVTILLRYLLQFPKITSKRGTGFNRVLQSIATAGPENALHVVANAPSSSRPSFFTSSNIVVRISGMQRQGCMLIDFL
jgi:hypothetical protein